MKKKASFSFILLMSLFLVHSAPMMDYIKMKDKPKPIIDWSLVVYAILVIGIVAIIIFVWKILHHHIRNKNKW